MSHTNSAEGHVKFNIEEESGHRSTIGIQVIDESNIQAHVGFMQLNHRYQLKIPLKLSHPLASYNTLPQPSLAVKNIGIAASEDDPKEPLLMCEFFAYKQKLLRERVQLSGPDDVTITVTVCARVLGPGQGTPMLLDGVKQIGVVPIEESEVSDWQGFD